jgi:hypothetical protein
MSIVSLEEVKAYGRISGTDDDETLQAQIDGAEAWINGFLCQPMAEMESVPADLKEAVKMLAVFWYDARGGTEIPAGVMQIVNQHRVFVF